MLQQLIEQTAIESALIFDENGDLVDSYEINSPERISAMSNVIYEMCIGLMEELKGGKLNQVIVKGDTLFFIASKMKNGQYLVSISSDITKLGFILKVIDTK